VPRQYGPRRAGDPSQLVADSSKLQSELGWRPRYTDFDEVVATAWRWHQTHPNGYED
jgi:UDP-glucose 4-epimerase